MTENCSEKLQRLLALPYLTLPYLRGGQALTPAQR